MYVVFKNIDDWFKSHEGLEKKFINTYEVIYTVAHNFAKNMGKMAKEKAGVNVKIEISENLLKQSLIDAFDDLLRLTNYHPTDKPNPIKEMSYIAYWLIKHKCIRLVTEDIIINDDLSDIAKTRFLFINEEFCVKLLMNAAFKGKEKKDVCKHIYDKADKQLKYFKQFLLYYLVYRVNSPKSLEAILLGCTIHPIWKVDPIIWSEPKNVEAEI